MSDSGNACQRHQESPPRNRPRRHSCCSRQDLPAALGIVHRGRDKRTSQGLDYGSEEWEKFHAHARNGIESVNSQVKKGSTNDLESSWRRRAGGIAVAQIFATFAPNQHNLKKIATFLKDQFTAEAQILVRKGDRTPRARDRYSPKHRTAPLWAVLRTSSGHATVGVLFCFKVRFPPEAVRLSSLQSALRSSVGLAIRQRNRAMLSPHDYQAGPNPVQAELDG